MQMIKKVSEFIEKHHMISPGDIVVAGISGGADSVCLFFVLLEMRKLVDFSFHVVHINHQIREEAGEDERFVEELCKRYNISFHAVHADVLKLAREKHITTEEAGREVRYEAFYQYLSEYAEDGNGKIAIAHNKNDSAETVLFHLFRGSGIQGLTGIAPVRDQIIRPLLCVERSEIEDYLREMDETYCTDKTNFTDEYARNRVRHHILEYARDEICQGAVTHTQEAAEKLSEIADLLNRLSKKAYEKCVVEGQGSAFIKEEALLDEETALRSYIVKYAMEEAIGTRKDIAAIHVDSVLELMGKRVGKQISLPYDYCAVKEYDGVRIKKMEKDTEKQSDESMYQISLFPEKEVWKEVILDDGKVLEYGIFTRVPDEIIPQKTYTKWFDYDKIKGRLFIRKRAASDFLIMNDKGQRQTIKSYFINEKVPRELRDCVNLLACDNHVLWVIGGRISNYYKVVEDTKLILKINLRGGAQDG